MLSRIDNPYRPGAGHQPPFLSGRQYEQSQFSRLIGQRLVSENIVITGLRGVGKTVLLDSFRQMATEEDWLWVGNDLSESAGLSEDRLSIRILTDLARALGEIASSPARRQMIGFIPPGSTEPPSYEALCAAYLKAPGLPSDKLRAAIDIANQHLKAIGIKGIVLAYDEAQCLTDHADRHQYPLSMLLETCQHLQRHSGALPFMLALSGLPTLLDALTESRTYTERMFLVLVLDRLSRSDTLAAVREPLAQLAPTLAVPPGAIERVADLAGGYPYLIQFFAKELVDTLLSAAGAAGLAQFPSEEAWRRLDNGLFAARWNRTTDRQREVLRVLAELPESLADFSAQEIVEAASMIGGPALTNAQTSQLLQGLVERGLIYRTRRGKFAFSLPMSQAMIRRRIHAESRMTGGWGEQAPVWAGARGDSLGERLDAVAGMGACTPAASPPPQPAHVPVSDELIAAYREVMRGDPSPEPPSRPMARNGFGMPPR